MALLISNAILHIIDNSGPTFSSQELDVDSETCYEFVSRHVRKLMKTPAAKEATFTAESEVYAMIKGYQKGQFYFKEMSQRICERLANIMRENREIPPADILVAAFDNGDKRYLAILKLNYGECFTHRVVEDGNSYETQIVKNTVVLPFSSGRVEEACLIPYDPMVLRIIEKPYPVEGEEMNYFSQLFLECETEISRKETVEIIQMVAEEINTKYYDDDVEMAVKVKCALMEEAEQAAEVEDDTLNLENVVRKVYGEQEEVAREFITMTADAGLPHEVKLEKPLVQRECKTQKFRADNGIEIKCPTELFRDPETIQLTTNSDGTISIVMKNLRRQQS